jgi:hypothetical protein
LVNILIAVVVEYCAVEKVDGESQAVAGLKCRAVLD